MITALKEEDGTITTNRERIIERCAEFYEYLYKDVAKNFIRATSEKASTIIDCEIEKAMKSMKNNKVPGSNCNRNADSWRRNCSGQTERVI